KMEGSPAAVERPRTPGPGALATGAGGSPGCATTPTSQVPARQLAPTGQGLDSSQACWLDCLQASRAVSSVRPEASSDARFREGGGCITSKPTRPRKDAVEDR